MSLRITQNMIYGNYVTQMQTSLSAYMHTSEQGSTQKKINTPSDDPAGMYKVLNLRSDTIFNQQLLSNCDTAKGWLKLEDSVLSTQMPTVITSIKELAEQASTGSYTAEQRRDIAYQVRQQFGSLLNMANTEFDGKNLFAGHKYDRPAFEQGLALSSKNETMTKLINEGGTAVFGDSDYTIAFQFTDDADLTQDGRAFRWTNNGGAPWYDGKSRVDPDDSSYTLIEFAGTGTYLRLKNTLEEDDGTGTMVSRPVTVAGASNLAEEGVDANDNTIYVRPAAFYQGDSNDGIETKVMGSTAAIASTDACGTFSTNNVVRIDSGLNSADNTFEWSYSTDNGANWVTARAMASGTNIRLPLPEGYLSLDLKSAGTLPAEGTQILIHPQDANVDYEIMKDTYITVNGVGKDIFGGYYEGKPAVLKPDVEGNEAIDGRNLFEVVGNFIAYLETNDQDGCQETLAKLAKAEEYILTQSTKVGGLENRVDVAYDVLTSQKLDIKERLSYVEDIDLTELLVKLQQQQITYQTVLQSASKIMNLSLANYL